MSYYLSTGTILKYAIEITDPSGTLAPASTPLNIWVQMEDFFTVNQNPDVTPPSERITCFKDTPLFFKDPLDGENRLVTLEDDEMTIKSLNSEERFSTSLVQR